jgi:lipopolysaccharide export system protein LptA
MNNQRAPRFCGLVFCLALLLPVLSPAGALAQQAAPEKGEADLLKRLDAINGTPAGTTAAAAASPARGTKDSTAKKPNDDQQQKAPTEITATKEATYDEKTRKAVFIGDVVVKDPQMTINCDKLTAFLRKEAADGAPAGSPSPSPAPKPSPAGANANGNGNGSGGRTGALETAVAEGTRENPVVIIQDKPAVDGGEPEHNVGKAERAEFDSRTGDVKLYGWPQVQQGINLHIATSAETVMTMNRDNHTMHTNGPSKTVIQEKTQPDGTTSQR